jgi:hypothetical protein
MITVSGFSSYTQALEYYNGFQTDKFIRNSAGTRMMTFLISDYNLNMLNNDKDPGRYQLFFFDNYLK